MGLEENQKRKAYRKFKSVSAKKVEMLRATTF